ncbi:hypothetical protein AAVH_22170 [Aphelenchoides avenae]|nr:hypothetical protein AAVH_22170 [Aphelenchus avenae]
MHLVFAASRYMRHHQNRVVKFLDAIMATSVKLELEAHVDTFYRKIRSGELFRSSKEIKAGTRKPDDAINAQSVGFCGLEALQAILLWNLRCEPARKYYVDHPHGPAFYATQFLNSDLVDAGLRATFRRTLLDAFSNRMDHARLRSYIEEVDFRRTYWSQTCILMDGWAKAHFGPKLRKDVDALQLDADPGVAGDELPKLFFAGSVERIVLMYGSDALNQDQATGIIPFYSQQGPSLRRAARLVLPAFTRRKMDGWKVAVRKLINSAGLKQLATVVYHPVGLRLMMYFEAYGSEAAWHAEVRSIMDESAFLFEQGVMERRQHMVMDYDLRLWTDDGLVLDWTMLSKADLRQLSKDAIHMTVIKTASGRLLDQRATPTLSRVSTPLLLANSQ